ncbi:GNAT family N-acetyltransferase [Peribacillus butanolivorans]|uniref:GNAT family N-acetyltransferase n=1 Tax=Peribacillus butanolivorans TaxID=421767 RepID=UPI00363CDA2E
MSNKNIVIRALESVEDLENVRRLESTIWSEYESTPTHQTLTAIKNGGIILGVFLENELIGFQYSFPGFKGEKIYLCSHILGIHPQHRKLGIGEKLKLAQKEESLKKGYDLVTWTYDPLETVNGYLNLHKLGARCSTYVENCYGEMEDDLNQGMPSDRFTVEWWIKEDTVERPSQYDLEGSDSLLIKAVRDSNGYFVPKETDLKRDSAEGFHFVPVPSDFQTLKKNSSELALSWRMRTREVFTHYFENGWTAVDLFRSKSDSDFCYYVLKKL